MPPLLLLCRHIRRGDEEAVRKAVRQTAAGGDAPPLEARMGVAGRLRDTLRNMRASSRQTAAEGDPSPPEEVVEVAERLAQTLREGNIRVVAVWHAGSQIATTHAMWLTHKLGLAAASEVQVAPHSDLHPDHFAKWSGTAPADELLTDLLRPLRATATGSDNANSGVLVVGHMPQLGWLASRLLRRRSLRRRIVDGFVSPLALDNGEVAAIALNWRRDERPQGHLVWTVAPDQKQVIDDLRDKVKSKMDIAKLLGGFMTLVLGGVLLAPGRLDELSEGGDRWAVYVAAVAFLIAIGLYLRTMYAYDSLLMPNRYWGEAPPGRPHPRWLVRRPPSSAAWVLYQNMLHIWTFLFTPATVAVAIGLVALSYAALEPGWLEGISASIVLIAFGIYAAWRRPVLGSQD